VAKYFQCSCPKCNGYLGIVAPERKMPVQANKWAMFEMWLSAGAGCGSREDDNSLPETLFSLSLD